MFLQKSSKLVLLIAALLVVLFAIDWGYKTFWYLPPSPSAYLELKASNTSFVEGETQLFAPVDTFAELAQNATKALKPYTTALAAAKNPAEEAVIKYKIAYATDLAGNNARAIELFKEVAADTEYPQMMRAYAVKYMISMLQRHGNPRIRRDIFKDEPYKSMAAAPEQPHASSLSVRHVSEYAVSLYPLAVPTLNIAIWYANDLRERKSTSTPEARADWDEIQKQLQAAEADLARTKGDESNQFTVAEGYEKKAELLGKLAFVGLSSQAEAETAFQTAFDFLRQLGINEKELLYKYAIYLSYFTPPDIAKIKKTLAPYSDVPANKAYLFTTERNNLTGQKADLARLARLDSEFKKVLAARGWTEKDFAFSD